MDNRKIMLNTQNEVTYTPQEEAIRNEATGLKNIVAKLEEINGKEQSFVASYFEGNNKIYVNRGFAYIRGFSVSDDKGSQFDLGVNQRALIYIKLNVTSAGIGNATISLEEVQQTDATSALQYLQNKNNKWSGPTHSGEWILPICYYITNQNGEVIHYEDLRELHNEFKIVDYGWQNLNLGSGLQHHSFGNKPQFRKIGNLVYFRGVLSRVDGGSILASANLFNVTNELVPKNTEFHLAATGLTGSNLLGAVRFEVGTDGKATLQVNTSVNATKWIALDGFYYFLD